MNKDFKDYEIKKVIGMDIEPIDREVGIMGNTFILCLEDETGFKHQLAFSDDTFIDLLETLKPHSKEYFRRDELE